VLLLVHWGAPLATEQLLQVVVCCQFPPMHETSAGGRPWQAARPSAQGGQAVPAVARVRSQLKAEESAHPRGPPQGAIAHLPEMQAKTSVVDLQVTVSVVVQEPPTVGPPQPAADRMKKTPTSD
jgi:hypothetical protein